MMRQGSFQAIDWRLLIPVSVLAIISLTTLLSINTAYFQNQLIYFVLGAAIFFMFSQMHYKMFAPLIVPLYLTSIVCLSIVLVIGFESRGAIRWIEILGVRVQFSEIFKPFLLLCLAGFLSSRSVRSFKTFLFAFLFLLPVWLLIALQPDLGSALLYGITLVGVLIVYGFPLLWFFLALLPFLFISPLLWTFLHGYQKQRIMTFLHPTSDPLGSSYNVMQAVIAVGSGMFFGRGLNEGTQSSLRFLPERHTDFIFATLSEGFGFVGSIVVVAAFVLLLYFIYRIYENCDDRFGKTYALGVFFFFLVQFFVNIGMNIGLLPVVGITLPFVSFGGSSIIASFIMLGILSCISSQTKRRVLEIR